MMIRFQSHHEDRIGSSSLIVERLPSTMLTMHALKVLRTPPNVVHTMGLVVHIGHFDAMQSTLHWEVWPLQQDAPIVK